MHNLRPQRFFNINVKDGRCREAAVILINLDASHASCCCITSSASAFQKPVRDITRGVSSSCYTVYGVKGKGGDKKGQDISSSSSLRCSLDASFILHPVALTPVYLLIIESTRTPGFSKLLFLFQIEVWICSCFLKTVKTLKGRVGDLSLTGVFWR